jgi:glycosyltransferase involved in cell wall biosynthesis/peptidoglycan/xylan/chitin deacetylase (PgdA/CDA1 family)
MYDACQRPARPKVLLLTYSCSPNRGSEPGVGWNWAVESPKNFDTWVISREGEFANEIRGYLKDQGEIPGLHFTFVDNCSLARHLRRIGALRYLFYNHWHRRAFRVAQRLHQQIGFDLVHQINFTGYREPGYLWKLDAPFVWGPIGGTQNYPWRFLGEAGIVGAFTEGMRSVLNFLQLHFSPRVRQATSRASLFLAANSTNQRDFALVHRVKPILMLETGIHSVAASSRRPDPNRPVLHILWSGDLAPHKGLPLLLKALSRLSQRLSCELRILGTGRLQRRWQRLARRLNVAGKVTWMGRLPHPQALDQYRWADVFVFTSLRDTSGNVVLEALAAGVPVVCLDHQGVRDIVTEECGIKIPVTVPSDVVIRLSEALTTLAQDSALWERMSAGALRRAREYEWPRQGERMAALYRRILGEPAFKLDLQPASLARDGSFGRNHSVLRNDELVKSHPFRWLCKKDKVKARESRGARRTCSTPQRQRDEAQRRDWPFYEDMRNAAKALGKRAAGLIAVSVERVFDVRAGERFGILVYHRVAPHDPAFPEPSLNVTPQWFREQIAGLIDRGYVIRPLREVLRNRALGLPPAPRTVVVTFDDGFAAVHAYAWPVLKEFKAPATVFLNTAFMDSGEPFPFDRWGMTHRQRLPVAYYRPLTSTECREMAQDGLIELGSHTHTHMDFRDRPVELMHDTQTSVDILRKRFGLKEVSFAFPGGRSHSGHSGEKLMAAVKRLPVTCALTTDGAPVDWRTDPFGWGRFNVYQWDTAATLTAKLKGCYGWAPRLQEWFSLCRLGPGACASGHGQGF